jgi:hypothetical protein
MPCDFWYIGDSPGEVGEHARSTMMRRGCGAMISFSRSAKRSTSTSCSSVCKNPGAADASPLCAAGGDDADIGMRLGVSVLRRGAAEDDSPLSRSSRVRGRFSFRSGCCSRGSESAGDAGESADFRFRPPRRLVDVLVVLGAVCVSSCASCSRAFSN